MGELKRGLKSGINMNLSQIGVKLWVESNWMCIRQFLNCGEDTSCIFMLQVKYGKGNTVLVGCCMSEICMSIIFAVKPQIAVSSACICMYYMHVDKFRLLACGF
jgi:hypothetical protein